ncbi:MAG: hypothetical protein NZ742_04500 [Acidobacteria bacterium]|nr:hypothetical protein [Acidobacteriota bacterium]MDW7983732.1 hypothetical protein [Acidobacteriota bacterium]
MRVRSTVLGWTVLGLSVLAGLGLLLGWFLRRQDRRGLVPQSEELPRRLAAVAEQEGAIFGIVWIYDPTALLYIATRWMELRLEPPALSLVIGYLATDAVLFGLQDPRLDRGWTAAAFLRASPTMAQALPWVRRHLPPDWQWQDRPAAPGCTNAFELRGPAVRFPWHLQGQICGSYLIVGEAASDLGERLWHALRSTAVGDTLAPVSETVRSAVPSPAAVLWFRPDRWPETLQGGLPPEIRTWFTAQVPTGQWVTLTVSRDTDRLEVQLSLPMGP